MNTLLAMDTSTSRASIALAVGDHVMHVEKDNSREHAHYILPLIAQLLNDANVTLASLDGIVMGRGPGSFTGVRIACSVVKGLAYPHQLPIYPVSSLAAIATEVFDTDKDASTVLTVIDARMREVYWDCYTLDGTHLDECVSPMSSLVLSGDNALIVAGVGFEDYWTELPCAIQQRCVQRRVVFPDARAMIRWVRLGRCRAVSVGDALPVYVRNQVVQGASGG